MFNRESIYIKYRAYQAAYILTNGATKDIIKDFDDSFHELVLMTDDELRENEKKYMMHIIK